MDYFSATLVTSNENRQREVSFEMRRTLLDWMLRRPARKHAFVRIHDSDVWRVKDSLRPANYLWNRICIWTDQDLSSLSWD